MNLNTFRTILTSTVSISDLTKAGAKAIFDNLNKEKSKIILRNNKPIAALVSPERYQELLEKEEDLQLLEMAISRKENNPSLTSMEDFFKEFNIDNEYLKSLPDIEMEV